MADASAERMRDCVTELHDWNEQQAPRKEKSASGQLGSKRRLGLSESVINRGLHLLAASIGIQLECFRMARKPSGLDRLAQRLQLGMDRDRSKCRLRRDRTRCDCRYGQTTNAFHYSLDCRTYGRLLANLHSLDHSRARDLEDSQGDACRLTCGSCVAFPVSTLAFRFLRICIRMP